MNSNTNPSSWYAVRTYSRHERTVAKHLAVRGFETLLPLYSEDRRWSDRQKRVELPLFPGYLFVRIDECDSQPVRVLRIPGVVNFVGNRPEFAQLSENDVTNIRSLITAKIAFQPHPYLSVGQRIRIRNGALAGVEGILMRVENDDRLVLSVEVIQRSLSVKIQGYRIEVV